MSAEIIKLPVYEVRDVCVPDCARSTHDVLAIKLPDDFLAFLGWTQGDIAIVSLLESPLNEEIGAISSNGSRYVGVLFFTSVGGVFVTDGVREHSRYFEPYTYEVLGRVDRICKSCERGECYPMKRILETPALPLKTIKA